MPDPPPPEIGQKYPYYKFEYPEFQHLICDQIYIHIMNLFLFSLSKISLSFLGVKFIEM